MASAGLRYEQHRRRTEDSDDWTLHHSRHVNFSQDSPRTNRSFDDRVDYNEDDNDDDGGNGYYEAYDVPEHVATVADVNDDVTVDDAVAPLMQSFACSSITELGSLCSIVEEEYDRRASSEVGKMLRDVDSMLYEPPSVVHNSHQQQIAEECGNWISVFPHLRVIGSQLLKPVESGVQYVPPPATSVGNSVPRRRRPSVVSKRSLQNVDRLSDARLTVSGQQVSVMESQRFDEEEVFEEDGCLEEIIAIDRLSLSADEDEEYDWSYKKRRSSTNRRLKRGLLPVTPISCIRENVVAAVFNDLFSAIWPAISPLLCRLQNVEHLQQQQGAKGRVQDGSWMMNALRLMQPPVNVNNLYSSDEEMSPAENTTTQRLESGYHVTATSSVHESHHLHSKPVVAGESYQYGSQTEKSRLDDVLTVRSKALLSRDKFIVNGLDLLSSDDASSQISSFSSVTRPQSSHSVLTSGRYVTGATSAQRRVSSYQRPGHLIPLQEEDRYRGEIQLQLQRPNFHSATPSPSPIGRVQNSSGQVVANVSLHSTSGGGGGGGGNSISNGVPIAAYAAALGVLATGGGPPSTNVEYLTSIALDSAHNPMVIGQSFSSSLAPSTTPAGSSTVSSSVVMRSLLPPLSHKRDSSSANINRTILRRKAVAAAAHASVAPYNKELRLLPGREREKSFVAIDQHYRPNTTHSVYRSETSIGVNRRVTANNPRHMSSTGGTYSAGGKRSTHLNLNITGSSIAHAADHSHQDPIVNPRNAELDLYEPGPLPTGLNLPQRRFHLQHITTLVR